jgi:hypothetical protein
VKLINKSKKLDTRLSRIEVALRSCRHLLRYEERGIETIGTPPSEAIAELQEAKVKIIKETAEEDLEKARSKSENAATPASKVSPFAKVIERIGGLYQHLDDVSVLQPLEQEARAYMDKARLDNELEKAEKAEFKGQKKKALDAYLDALFLIRKDSIDDAKQQKEISQIELKIRELGGEVPSG